MWKLASVVLTFVWLLGTPAKALNIVSLMPDGFDPGIPILVGQTVDFSLEMDFTDNTLGGGVTISFDSNILSLVSIVFDAGFTVDDKDFRCPTDATASNPVSCPPDPAFVSWGNFNGVTGAHTVALVTLQGIDAGESDVSIAVSSSFAGPTGSPLAVQTSGSSAMVPEPGTSVLLLALAGVFAAVSRRVPWAQ